MKSYNGKVYKEIDGVPSSKKPIWLMRQAGRYLPEYREIRHKKESFIEFCFDKNCIVEATLQPIRRFGFDAAIIFSDILILPHLLGQTVQFKANVGPVLGPILNDFDKLNINERIDINQYHNVLEAIQDVRSNISSETSLIGFCGAPWTVASYMIAGGSSSDQAPARIFAYNNREIFNIIIDILIDQSIEILDHQIKAGVDIVQIFDTWAGVLPIKEFQTWCVMPCIKISSEIKKRHPKIKVILFAKGFNWLVRSKEYLKYFDALSLDTSIDLSYAHGILPISIGIQGNLDPLALLSGGTSLISSIEDVLNSVDGRSHVFNLGHGILPRTPIENVELLVHRVRSF